MGKETINLLVYGKKVGVSGRKESLLVHCLVQYLAVMMAPGRERLKEVRMVLKKEMMSASWKAREYLKEK